MVRGGSVGWTAGWDLLTIFRQSSWSSSSRWWQQETRCKCLVPQRYRHVDLGHLHQISQLVCSAATAAPAAAAVPWDHHCCEDCQAQEQQEPFELIFQTPDPEMICIGRQELLHWSNQRIFPTSPCPAVCRAAPPFSTYCCSRPSLHLYCTAPSLFLQCSIALARLGFDLVPLVTYALSWTDLLVLIINPNCGVLTWLFIC